MGAQGVGGQGLEGSTVAPHQHLRIRIHLEGGSGGGQGASLRVDCGIRGISRLLPEIFFNSRQSGEAPNESRQSGEAPNESRQSGETQHKSRL
jgi:hypothetical protein